MRPASQKQKIIIASSLSILIAWLFYFLVTPASAYALTIEPVYKVLQTAGPVKDVWKNVRNMINVLVIAALIFIAFANILRINLNNYAIKKFLPALIFGIVAANFSYFICQFLVDIANVAMSLLMNGAGGSANGSVTDIGVGGAFGLTQEIDTANLWKSFVYVVAEFAGAVVIFILAFLFLIRNYIIYFTVVLSPLAFMCTAIPETKTVFKQWSGWFIKWTFMPIVSIFWLWLGALWYNAGMKSQVAAGDFNAYLLAIVFAGVCYYLAITTPFKMGGAQMAMMGKLGKGALGLAGTVTGARAIWNYNREKGKAIWTARGIGIQNGVKRWTGIGKGLDEAKQALDDQNKRRGLIQDSAKSDYIKKAGDRRAKWQMDNMSLEGSSQYEEAMAMGHFVKNQYTNNGEYKDWIRKKRFGSTEGSARMKAAQDDLSGLNSEMVKAFYNSELKNGKKLKYDDIFEINKDGTKIVPKAGKEKDAELYNKRQELLGGLSMSAFESEIKAAEAKKASEDPVKNIYKERVSADNAFMTKLNAEGLHNDLQELIDLQKKSRTAEGLSQKEESKYHNAMGKLMANGYKVQGKTDEELEAFKPILQQKKDQAEIQYQAKLKYIEGLAERNGGQLPTMFAGLVEPAPGGGYQLKGMGNLERSRAGKWLGGEITDDASSAIQKYSTEERLASLRYGNAIEGFTKQDLDRFFRGKQFENTPKVNFTIESFVRSTVVPTSQNSVEGQQIAGAKIDLLKTHADAAGDGNYGGYQEIIETVNKTLAALPDSRKMGLGGRTIDQLSATATNEEVHAALKEMMGSNNGYKILATALNSNKTIGHGGMPASHG